MNFKRMKKMAMLKRALPVETCGGGNTIIWTINSVNGEVSVIVDNACHRNPEDILAEIIREMFNRSFDNWEEQMLDVDLPDAWDWMFYGSGYVFHEEDDANKKKIDTIFDWACRAAGVLYADKMPDDVDTSLRAWVRWGIAEVKETWFYLNHSIPLYSAYRKVRSFFRKKLPC